MEEAENIINVATQVLKWYQLEVNQAKKEVAEYKKKLKSLKDKEARNHSQRKSRNQQKTNNRTRHVKIPKCGATNSFPSSVK